jgi:hypothetical protein
VVTIKFLVVVAVVVKKNMFSLRMTSQRSPWIMSFESWRTHNGKAKFGYLTMFMLKRKKRKGKRGNRGAKRKEFRIF